MFEKVSVIVLCYNGLELTRDCLMSLLQQDYPALEIILVDNGSQDGTIETISAEFPQVLWVKNNANLGYALGNNKGIELAMQNGAGAVFLVNNDTRLDQACTSSLMCRLRENPKIGVIGPMVYTWEGNRTISSAGGMVNWRLAYADNMGMGEIDEGRYPGREVDFVNGCGILATRKVIEQVGGLDPKFFMYWEETDWCLRAKKGRFQVYFEPQAKMEHKASIESTELSPTTLYYLTRNRFLFFSRHAPAALKFTALAHALDGALAGVRKNRAAGKKAHAKAMQMAIWHALRGKWGMANSKLWQVEPGR